MNSININVQAPQSPVLEQKSSLSDPGLSKSISVVSDAELVKKVVNTEIKDSNVSANTQPSREAVAKAAEQIQTFVKEMGRNLDFSIDETTGYNVVKVVNPDTNEVVRQLPSEELLKIARSMENWNSVLVNQKA
jgi:flagellar protein FlaG